jgi:hypothetical protein
MSTDDKVEIVSKSTRQIGGVTVNFTVGRIKPTPPRVRRLMPGLCGTCDQYRDNPMMPSHGASPRCESGGHTHCTCDTCF